MELKDIFSKLDSMNEQISKLRETAARTEGILKESMTETRSKYTHIQGQMDLVTQQQQQWKGAMVVISTIIGLASTIVARILFK